MLFFLWLQGLKGFDELLKAVEDIAVSKNKPRNLSVFDEIRKIENASKNADDETKEEAEVEVADLRYKTIDAIVAKTVKKSSSNKAAGTKSDKLDKVLTNRILGIPIFLGIMYAMYACTFSENFLWLGLPSPGVWLAGVVESVGNCC